MAAVLGTQSGVLAIFSWGNWGDMTDRFIGHPQSVESMVKVDEVFFCFFYYFCYYLKERFHAVALLDVLAPCFAQVLCD